MGLPGSYIVATENSYVGSLVEMAGGQNVYAGTDEEFLSANTEGYQNERTRCDFTGIPCNARAGTADVCR